jgi:hypothetical protein
VLELHATRSPVVAFAPGHEVGHTAF